MPGFEGNADLVRGLLDGYENRVLGWFSMPREVKEFMEAGTLSAVINSLLEADFAHLHGESGVARCRAAEHHRDGYPDFQIGTDESAPRVEMKGLWRKILHGEITSSGKSKMEPSARLREPQDDIRPDDVLLIVVWDFFEQNDRVEVGIPDTHPPIVCSALAAAKSRDERALENGARFIPGERIPVTTSGRPETNFGKLNRIPYVRSELGLPALKVRKVEDLPPELGDEPPIEAPTDPELADELTGGRDVRRETNASGSE